jgi:sec-independent protein translocase protein TatB
MFEIGFGEVVLVAVVGLLVLRPERLPRVARKAGLWIRKGRSVRAGLLDEIERELELEELRYALRREPQRGADRDLDRLTLDALAAFPGESPEHPGGQAPASTPEPAQSAASPS